jgi:hypothetical protein
MVMKVPNVEALDGGMHMKHQTIFLSLLMLVALFLGSCKDGENDPRIKVERIDGIEHVTNTGEPLRGRMPLEVAEVFRIDPDELKTDSPPLFDMAAKDDAGNLYLADLRNVGIYKFDSGGRLVSNFLRKGQGPGEFPRFGDLQIFDGHAWVIGNWPMKIAKFSLDGRFVDEWTFPSFRNFYLRTLVVDEDRFLTVSYRDLPEGQGRVRVSALMDSREEFLTQYYEDADAGIFRIRAGAEEGPAVASTNPLVAADIHHAVDHRLGTVFVCNNKEYEIEARDADGTILLVIRKIHQKPDLDDAAKGSILGDIAPQLSPQARQSAKEGIPDTLNAIWGISVLPNGYLAVKRITGLDSVEIDLFDAKGRLLYTILPSAEIPDLKRVTIYGKTVGVISEMEDKNVYFEYRVKNLTGVFE